MGRILIKNGTVIMMDPRRRIIKNKEPGSDLRNVLIRRHKIAE